MRSITVAIPEASAARLEELAAREFRRPKDQAAALLVEAIDAAERQRAASAEINAMIRTRAGRVPRDG